MRVHIKSEQSSNVYNKVRTRGIGPEYHIAKGKVKLANPQGAGLNSGKKKKNPGNVIKLNNTIKNKMKLNN